MRATFPLFSNKGALLTFLNLALTSRFRGNCVWNVQGFRARMREVCRMGHVGVCRVWHGTWNRALVDTLPN
ncbi:hypothetical protein B0T20DRAFT_415947 [Sordaria brevicollis]|uniref:Secreted protein n=1 Tax=Sordaria brevicollis TaxID=83679 RepID=A0AAE0PCF5_SORBR|nr:hypothetical protein B0T20DRAFT_415947 [Sordaria brevicollis]